MSEDETITEKTKWALRTAAVATLVALLLATILLFKETAITFVLFMFLGPALLLLAAVCLGWVILKELRMKKVL
jgi:hypothetical protein